MGNKIGKAVIGGIAGTAVMSGVMFLAPMMGIPKMSPPEMLAGMMGLPVIAGWLMHFMIGIIFSMAYAFVFINLVKKVNSNLLKGIIFGTVVFLFAQVMMTVMGLIKPLPPMEGSMLLIMLGSIMGHIIYGIVVALIVKDDPVTK